MSSCGVKDSVNVLNSFVRCTSSRPWKKLVQFCLKPRVIDRIDLENCQLVKGANDSCMQFLKKEMRFNSCLIFLSKC